MEHQEDESLIDRAARSGDSLDPADRLVSALARKVRELEQKLEEAQARLADTQTVAERRAAEDFERRMSGDASF